MIYVFYIFWLISFAIANDILCTFLVQNFDIWFRGGLLVSSVITGILYGAVFKWVITTPLILVINELLEYIHPLKIETNHSNKKWIFTKSHREKLRLSDEICRNEKVG